jgi:phosphoglycerol transferase
VQVGGGVYKGNVDFTKESAGSQEMYQKTVNALNIDDAQTRYQSPAIAFMLPGLPQQVKAISGLSDVENWGRWSDANVASAVKIDYVDPLPANFDVVLRARAYGNNIGKPISVKVGDEEHFVTFSDKDQTLTVQFSNAGSAQSIVITPPSPTEPTEGTSGGFEPRKLGIGLVSLSIEDRDTQS